MQPILIYAKWTHRQSITAADGTQEIIYYYEVPIPPSAPMKVGACARVILLTSAKHHSLARSMGPAPPLYDTYDQQIEGTIAYATPLSGGAIAFVVENGCAESPVRYAHIAAPYAPGRTTSTSPYRDSAAKTLEIPQPAMRYRRALAIEEDAIVDKEAWIRMLPPTPPLPIIGGETHGAHIPPLF